MAEKIPESDVQKVKTKHRLGFMKGQISVPYDFDIYSAEIEEMFYGGKSEPDED